MKTKLLFCAFMLSCLLPLAAYADASGKCGDNLTWIYVEATHTLTISGKGKMSDFDFDSGFSPWLNFYDVMTTVVINEGVTSIGSFAFSWCSGLTSVIIPNSVTSIGDSAFDSCNGLTSITIPNSVTSIGDYAFTGCSDLTRVTIGNSVISIGDNAFDGCSGLTSITIPNSVTTIGESTFQGCNGLTSITVNTDNTVYDSRDNCNAIIETATNTLIVGCNNSIIPNSVTTIGDNAFYDCSGLTSITIPNSVTSIGDNAFNGTGWYNAQADGLLYLDNCLLGYKGDIPTGAISIKGGTRVIAGSAFYGCSGLTSITIPNSVTSIGKSVFGLCHGLISITIPNSVTSIGEGAFSSCSGLISITIPNSVITIGRGAFSDCKGLTRVTIGNSVTSIGDNAFYGCSGLNSITIPNSVITIGRGAFQDCKGLTSITIPNSVTTIGESAFQGCNGLTSITIPNSVTTIGECAFNQDPSALTSITVNSDNTVYDSRDNCNAIIETATNTLIVGCNNSIIPNSVTSIGRYAFFWCSGLTSITIPNSVTTISDCAFYGCYLTSITIPNSVTSIGHFAFYDCSGLTSITIPNSVTSISDYAFYGCRGLTEVRSMIKEPFAIDNGVFSYYSNIFGKDKFTSATLYIPAGTKAKYEATAGWKDFKTFFEMEPDETVPVGNALVAGYSSDKALDFSNSDVTAWIATGVRGGNIQLSRVDIVPANTGIYVKASEAGDFDVPSTTEKSYYVNMFQPVVTATTVQPTVTIDGVTYQTLSFALSKETGKPGFFPNTEAKNYGNNKMYLQLPEWVLTAPTSGTTTSERVPVTIGTLGVAGFSSDKNLDFTSSDVEAWVATGFKGGNVQLSRVYAVPAGTGIYVKSKKTLTASTTFQIPVTTEVPYYVNLFVGLPNGGTVSPTEVVGGVTMQTLSFATSKTTGKPAFFPNTEDKTYSAGKMYLRLPADLVNGSDAARSLGLVFVDGDNVGLMEAETTGISLTPDPSRKGDGSIYSINGLKMNDMPTKKGVYIINGRKVVIK